MVFLARKRVKTNYIVGKQKLMKEHNYSIQYVHVAKRGSALKKIDLIIKDGLHDVYASEEDIECNILCNTYYICEHGKQDVIATISFQKEGSGEPSKPGLTDIDILEIVRNRLASINSMPVKCLTSEKAEEYITKAIQTFDVFNCPTRTIESADNGTDAPWN